MAQAWVDGHLPYTLLWDVKPPLTFLFYAIIIFLFGKSFIAIRLIGALLVALSSFFAFKITVLLSNRKAAMASGIASVVMQSMFGSIQGVMSEHILMFFFMGGLYLLMDYHNYARLFLGGILLGVSLMVKISIAFPILFLGIALLFLLYRDTGLREMVKKILVLTAPAILVVLLTILPYYQIGKPELWWNSVFFAPLAYTDAGRSPIVAISAICIVVLGFIFWSWKTEKLALQNQKILLVVICIVGVLLSFLKGGRANSHYLIMLYPLLLIILAISFSNSLKVLSRRKLKWVIPLLLLLPVESYIEYVNIYRNKIERGTFYNGEGFTVPEYIEANKVDTTNILFLGYHIGYWVLNAYPPVKTATHPSNICKSEMFPYYNSSRKTGLEELQFIVEEIKPKTIVARYGRRVFDKAKTSENEYIDTVLNTRYAVEAIVDNAVIYRLLD